MTRATSTVAFLLLLAAAPASAQSASGGALTLDRGAQDSGGAIGSSGGGLSLNGALGEAILPSGSEAMTGGALEARSGFYNPPRFAFLTAQPAALSDPSGRAILAVQPGSVPSSEFELIVRQDPLANPVRADPQRIAQANATIRVNQGAAGQVLPANTWEVAALDAAGVRALGLSAPATLSLAYADADGDGIVDGTSPPVRARTLSVWLLDEERGMWVKTPGSAVDLAARRVTASIGRLGVYALIGAPDGSVSDAYAFPVPYRPYGPRAGGGPGQTGTEASGITFTNLPSEGSISIYDVAGTLVRKLAIPSNLAPAALSWDGRNESGQSVASGVYLWRIASGSNAKRGRLAIIW